jgi:hypothetical protein
MRAAARRNAKATFKLTITRQPARASARRSVPDHADGNMGGPDFWEVRDVASSLNVAAPREPKLRRRVFVTFDHILFQAGVNPGMGCPMMGSEGTCRPS